MILKGIALSSLASPALVFMLFLITGIVFYASNVIFSGSVDPAPLLGMLIGGSAYAVLTALISVPATFLVGFPLAELAERRDLLTAKVVLAGATLSGALALTIFAIVYFSKVSDMLILIALVIGGVGGFVNGYAFWKYVKPNHSFERDAGANAPRPSS